MSRGIYIATRPIGILPFSLLMIAFYHFDQSYLSCVDSDKKFTQDFWKYEFHLANYLRLHLTLFDVYFSPHTVKQEQDGACYTSFIEIMSRFSTSETGVRYCGIYSTITQFPPSKNIVLSVNVHQQITVKISMNYSVIDAHRVESGLIRVEETNSWHWMYVFKYLKHSHLYLEIFHIKVLHYENINVLFTFWQDEFATIFGGPGDRSKPTTNIGPFYNKTQILFETFQILVHLYHRGKQSLSGNHTATKLCYASEKAGFASILALHEDIRNISLPQSHICSNISSCRSVMQCKTELGKSFNISLNTMSIRGHSNSHECSSAGIAVYQEIHNTLSLVRTVCVVRHVGKMYDRSDYLFRREEKKQRFVNLHNMVFFEYHKPLENDTTTIFSGSNTVLVFYYYKEYGNLIAHVSISDIPCQTAMIDTCEGFNKYLSNVNNAKLLRPLSYFGTNWLLWHTSCYILHFHRSYWSRRWDERVCKTNLGISKPTSMEKTKMMSLVGMGYMKGKSHQCPAPCA